MPFTSIQVREVFRAETVRPRNRIPVSHEAFSLDLTRGQIMEKNDELGGGELLRELDCNACWLVETCSNDNCQRMN